MSEEKEEMLAMLRYFWEEKGDIERWCDFDRNKIIKYYPEVLAVWDVYKISERTLTAVLNGVE